MPKKSVKKPAAPRGNAKITRWIDLLAALLDHHAAVTFERLTELVPAYQRNTDAQARRRMFERDKDELRNYGVPILTDQDGSGNVRGYRLRSAEFYMPYLTLLQDGKPASTPRRVDRDGYRALTGLAFEADELEAVREAALRVRRLGVAELTELAASAMRKLAFDLPMDVDFGVAETSADLAPAYLRAHEVRQRAPEMSPDEIFDALDTALHAHKRVTIRYTKMGGASMPRDVWPFGLFFLGRHWYLAAQDAGAAPGDPVKNFRVSRISHAAPNTAKPGTADYVIPASFSLPGHARSREAWELGDTATIDAVVRFAGESGPTTAARRLGDPVAGEPDCRRFSVRRMDTFARWVLSFAGEAEPVAPPELVAQYRQLAGETLAAYAEA
jgi:proteasome accessory factor B